MSSALRRQTRNTPRHANLYFQQSTPIKSISVNRRAIGVGYPSVCHISSIPVFFARMICIASFFEKKSMKLRSFSPPRIHFVHRSNAKNHEHGAPSMVATHSDQIPYTSSHLAQKCEYFDFAHARQSTSVEVLRYAKLMC